MDRYLLRYFLAIVETGNFSRAAARGERGAAHLSRGDRQAGGPTGARLFDRTNRRVHLTEAGGRFLIHARRIEHEFNLAQAAVSGARQVETLRVGVLSTIPTALIETTLGVQTSRRRTRSSCWRAPRREVLGPLDRRGWMWR